MPALSMRARLMGLALLLALAACSSMPSAPAQTVHRFNPETDPYWDDPRWEAALLNAIQSVVHAPDDVNGSATPALHGEVQFTLVNGDIEHIALAQSTGDPQMDELLLQQVATAHAPQPTGPHAGESHDFILELNMPTALELLEDGIYTAISYRKLYPKEAILGGHTGIASLEFNYMDGKAMDVTVAKSSDDRDLDKASVRAVTNATLPPVPANYVGKSLPMQVVFCYALGSTFAEAAARCPQGKNIIQVVGTRIRRVGF